MLFSAWVTAPVLDRVTVETWRAAAALAAVMIGAGGVAWTRSCSRSTFAVLVGLLGAAVWLEFDMPVDAAPRHPSFVGVHDSVISLGRELILLPGGACAGGMPVWLWRRNGR